MAGLIVNVFGFITAYVVCLSVSVWCDVELQWTSSNIIMRIISWVSSHFVRLTSAI